MNDTSRHVDDTTSAALRERLAPNEMVQTQRATRYPVSIEADVFSVQSNADGDGVYDCYKQSLQEKEWEDTDGTDRFADENTTPIEVLNLLESNVEVNYTRALIKGDRLIAFEVKSLGPTEDITSITRAANVVTVSLSSVEGFEEGFNVQIMDVSDSSFAGTFKITSKGESSISYLQTGGNASSGGGKAVMRGIYRWVGVPLKQQGESIRHAFCAEAASAVTNTIKCYLDTDATPAAWAANTLYHIGDCVYGTDGEHYLCKQEHTATAANPATEPVTGADYATYWELATVTVIVDIWGNGYLATATPLLTTHMRIPVYRIGSQWYAVRQVYGTLPCELIST